MGVFLQNQKEMTEKNNTIVKWTQVYIGALSPLPETDRGQENFESFGSYLKKDLNTSKKALTEHYPWPKNLLIVCGIIMIVGALRVHPIDYWQKKL